MRANAMAVCLGLLALLLAVSGFWAWTLLVKERKLASRSASAPPERQRVTLGIIDILQKEEATPPLAPAQSPFLTRYNPPVPVPVYTNVTVTLPPRVMRPKVEVVPPPPPPPLPPPETVTLTFRGTMERTDGIVQALFEVDNSKSKRTSFVRRQDSLYGIRVDSISLTTVSVVRQNGTTNEMRVGDSERIQEVP